MFYLFNENNPWNFEWELIREWVETPLTWWGERWRHSKFVAAYPSYIRRGRISISPHTCSRCSTFRPSAWRSHGRIVSPRHHAVVLLVFPVVLLLPLPCWIEGTKVVIMPYVYRVRRHCPLQCTSSRSWDRRVNNYIIHENYSRNAYDLRGWVLLELGLPVADIH